MAHFWTRIWSGRSDRFRFGSETWDDGNTSNSDGFKTPGSDGETSNIKQNPVLLWVFLILFRLY